MNKKRGEKCKTEISTEKLRWCLRDHKKEILFFSFLLIILNAEISEIPLLWLRKTLFPHFFLYFLYESNIYSRYSHTFMENLFREIFSFSLGLKWNLRWEKFKWQIEGILHTSETVLSQIYNILWCSGWSYFLKLLFKRKSSGK